jgi:hypothetical protein
MWLGDDFHHNGAFRLSYGFEYAASMETSKENESFNFDRYDTYEWYLALGPLSNVNARHLTGRSRPGTTMSLIRTGRVLQRNDGARLTGQGAVLTVAGGGTRRISRPRDDTRRWRSTTGGT